MMMKEEAYGYLALVGTHLEPRRVGNLLLPADSPPVASRRIAGGDIAHALRGDRFNRALSLIT